MTIDELSIELDKVLEGGDWNEWVKLARNSGVKFDKSNIELTRKAGMVLAEILKSICPQEYKDNPHIHYEVAKKKK